MNIPNTKQCIITTKYKHTLWNTFLYKTKIDWFIERVKSALYWAKIGWRLYYFDAGFGVNVLHAFYEKLYSHFESNPIHVNDEKNLRRIKEFKYVLKRLRNDDYFVPLYEDREMLFLTEKERNSYEDDQRNQDWDFIVTYLKKYSTNHWWN